MKDVCPKCRTVGAMVEQRHRDAADCLACCQTVTGLEMVQGPQPVIATLDRPPPLWHDDWGPMVVEAT